MMGAEVKKSAVPLSSFIIKQCRSFQLFPDENTTVLSRGDELQVMQFCLACQNKKATDRLDADSHTALMLVNKIRRSDWLNLEQMVVNSSRSENSLPERHETNMSPDGSNTAHGQAFLGPIQANPPHELVSPDKNEVHEDRTEDSKEAESLSCVEPLVLALFHEYKDTNNHWTLMDVYTAFLKALTDKKSDLCEFIAANEDVDSLESDLEEWFTLQTQIINFVQGIRHTSCVAVKPCSESTSIDTSQEVQVQTPAHHMCHQSLLLSPKTPVAKFKVTTASSEKTPAEVPAVTTPKTPVSPCSGKTLKEIFVEDLFRSYLHLLMNSRSQLALARIFNIPERELNHEAFTHLKHEASVCGLSMYQTLSSFMLRIHLGGQGYAPTRDNPLLTYVKGLGSLLDMIQKLQTIIEEVHELSIACSRIVNVIKNTLIRCKSGKFPSKLVTPVAEKVSALLMAIINDMEVAHNTMSYKQADRKGSSILGYQCLQVIQQFLDRTALMESRLDLLLMGDISFSSTTPTRFPCLLTQFRSPSIMDSKEEDTHDDNVKTIQTVSRYKGEFVSAALYIDVDNSSELLLTQGTMSTIEVVPSKTIIHPRVGAQDDHRPHKSTSINEGMTALSDVKNSKHPKGRADKRMSTSVLDKENLIVSPAKHGPGPDKKVKRTEIGVSTKAASPKMWQKAGQEVTTPKPQICRFVDL